MVNGGVFKRIVREGVLDIICRRTRGRAMAPRRGGGRGERNVRERERLVFEQGGRMVNSAEGSPWQLGFMFLVAMDDSLILSNPTWIHTDVVA